MTRGATRAALIGAIVLALLAGAALALSHGGRRAAPAPRRPTLRGDAAWASGRRPAPPFTLPDQQGRRFSLARERGRVVVLAFAAASCRTLCPLETAAIGRVVQALPRAARPDVVIVSVDPAGDTPVNVRRSLRRLGVVPRAAWLDGSQAALKRVWHDYGVLVRPVPGDIEHTSVVYLIDRRGDERVGALFPFSEPDLVHDLRLLAGPAGA